MAMAKRQKWTFIIQRIFIIKVQVSKCVGYLGRQGGGTDATPA